MFVDGMLPVWLWYTTIVGTVQSQCSLCRFGEDAYAWYKRGSHEGWRPDADMYEQLLSWMCTQENLVDEAETIIRKEMPVRPFTLQQDEISTQEEGRVLCARQAHHAHLPCHLHLPQSPDFWYWAQSGGDLLMFYPACRRQALRLQRGMPTRWFSLRPCLCQCILPSTAPLRRCSRAGLEWVAAQTLTPTTVSSWYAASFPLF